MPSKFELASYLVNLHNLLEAQEAAGSVQKSSTLAEEYEKNWSLLKSTITKENSDEARNRNHRDFDEGRTNPPRDQSRRGSPTRHDGDI